ncbi:hypothetical protein BD289DRAFT_238973 [Coniella lustricola]|uniref:Ribonucleases P/MRP subunit Pop8-like domain-containing protein n=1 Tax=Coniella lustricola TaxID=2025994 RepID=A0A2T3ALG1_9PEZI|nr:hypothetical protein BD289DRAFT_238973 [Coniella lustricola]
MKDAMDIDMPLAEAIESASKTTTRSSKSHDIYTTTIRTPPHAYAHLELITRQELHLDELLLRQYLTSALRQYLGLTGLGISVDILKISGQEGWVRVPRQDLGTFSSALTAWIGTGSASGFRIRAAGNWLGALVGGHDQQNIWGEA